MELKALLSAERVHDWAMGMGTFSARGAAVCCWPKERVYLSSMTQESGCLLKTYETRNPLRMVTGAAMGSARGCLPTSALSLGA